MSDDLISRKALLNNLRGNVLVDVTSEIEKAIDDQPTVFDKEKVIEKIKTLAAGKVLDFTVDSRYEEGYVQATKDIIDIIEKGGIE